MINQRVLVLNKLWTAVQIVSLRKALTLIFSECTEGPYKGQPKARIIDPVQQFATFTWEDWTKLRPQPGEACVKGCSDDFRIPEVIMLTAFDKVPGHRVNFSRRSIYRRDNSRCQYCGDKVGTEGTIDHVIPKSKGGTTTWENIVLACFACNSQKADRTPDEAVRGNRKEWRGPSPMKLLSTPIKPKYNILKGDRGYVIPKTWEAFVSTAYWHVPLQNDMTEE